MPAVRRVPPLPLLLTLLTVVPGALLGAATSFDLPRPEPAAPLAAAVFGVAIVGAAFLLSWAAEAAQVDVGAGLALALLALLAVLPEYAVDFVFSLQAGRVFAEQGACVAGPDGTNPCALALANMTGANRVLIGIGWPLVVAVAAVAVYRARRSGAGPTVDPRRVAMPRTQAAEVVFLGGATLYSLHLPLRTSLTLVDLAVLVSVFVLYAARLAKAPAEDPDLIGVSRWVGTRPRRPRRTLYATMFALAALVILACAEHFADSLVATGSELGVDRFLLVQWVAPVASEAPELIVACLYALRLKAADSLGALLSSKVNQWTLLVGTVPLVFALSSGSLHGLPLDGQQRLELLLTAAQSLFAVSLLVTLALSVRGAVALFGLFVVQFLASILLPTAVDQTLIVVLSGVYLVAAVGQLLRHRRLVGPLVRDGLRTPYPRLTAAADDPAAP